MRVWDADGRETSEYETIGKRGLAFTLFNEGTVQSTKSFTRDTANSANKYDNAVTTTYSYERWDDARQSNITVSGVGASAGATGNGYSTFKYDVNGHLKSAIDTYAKRGFVYITDSDGQILRRDEALNGTSIVNGSVVNPTVVRQHQYLNFAGNRVGDIGNDGIDTTDYAQVLARDLKPDPNAKALDRFKRFTPVMASNFDTGTNPINDLYPSAAPGNVTVREGDTLQSIAQSQWGDASLWYLLADANGLTGSETLTAGMVLNVPSKVANLHNNTGTFKVYDAGKAIGDTGPTLPDPPPANKGCGAVGMILAIVVAIVVTAMTSGTTSGFWGGIFGNQPALVAVADAATAAAAGSVASQGVLIATGNQDHFSWKGVALAAIGGGISSFLPTTPFMTDIAKNLNLGDFGRAALNAGASSVVTQGIGVATGLQDHFSWKGVAASAISAGVAKEAGIALSNVEGLNGTVGKALAGLAGGVASAAVRGGSISRQMPGILQDVIGNTIGNMIADNLKQLPTTGDFARMDGNSYRGLPAAPTGTWQDDLDQRSQGLWLRDLSSNDPIKTPQDLRLTDEQKDLPLPVLSALVRSRNSQRQLVQDSMALGATQRIFDRASLPTSAGDGDIPLTMFVDDQGEPALVDMGNGPVSGYGRVTVRPPMPTDADMASTNYAALGLTDLDNQIEESRKAGTAEWDAFWYATKYAFYTGWNGATLGYVGRQDAREVQYTRGTISQAQYWGATGVDAGASIALAIVAPGASGAAGRMVLSAGGSRLASAAVSGGTFGALTDGGIQLTNRAIGYATDGATGQTSFNGTEFLAATALGAVIAGGSEAFMNTSLGRYLADTKIKIGFEYVPSYGRSMLDRLFGNTSMGVVEGPGLRIVPTIELERVGNSVDLEASGAGSSTIIFNSKGVPYPKMNVRGYGEVPFPSGPYTTNNTSLRSTFTPEYKAQFKDWWTNQGFDWPEGNVNIHHIKPLSKGGTNAFENLVPLLQPEEHLPFTTWWRSYP
jgi:hypothetical protein